MTLLPPRYDAYHGSRAAISFRGLLIAINAVRGVIHVFWRDSGAGRIEGIDLTVNGPPVVSLLAQVGLPIFALMFWLSPSIPRPPRPHRRMP